MPIARASDLVKTYGAGRSAVRILSGLDLELEAGEVVAVVGRSGSGKSTLLHLLGALDRPDSGVIEIGGRRIHAATEKELSRLRRTQVGFVFQSFHLLPELTGLENVLLPARLAGDEGALDRGRALVASLGLVEVARQLPTVLSGGEQQRLAVARALVNDPLLVLADEPTGNLDPQLALDILGLFEEIHENGTTVLFATHDRSLLDVRARRLIVLDEGKAVDVPNGVGEPEAEFDNALPL